MKKISLITAFFAITMIACISAGWIDANGVYHSNTFIGRYSDTPAEKEARKKADYEYQDATKKASRKKQDKETAAKREYYDKQAKIQRKKEDRRAIN